MFSQLTLSAELPWRALVSEPIVFISRNRIKTGRGDEFRKHYQGSIPSTMEAKPGTQAQLAYVNEEANEVVIVRFFPSADALDHQIQGADERSKKTYELIEPTGIEILGIPNPSTLLMMNRIAGSGVPVSISPHYMGGFVR